MNEEISYHQNSEKIIDRLCYNSGINLVNTEEEVNFVCIYSKNETNYISMNDEDNFSINIMHHYYHQISINM